MTFKCCSESLKINTSKAYTMSLLRGNACLSGCFNAISESAALFTRLVINEDKRDLSASTVWNKKVIACNVCFPTVAPRPDCFKYSMYPCNKDSFSAKMECTCCSNNHCWSCHKWFERLTNVPVDLLTNTLLKTFWSTCSSLKLPAPVFKDRPRPESSNELQTISLSFLRAPCLTVSSVWMSLANIKRCFWKLKGRSAEEVAATYDVCPSGSNLSSLGRLANCGKICCSVFPKIFWYHPCSQNCLGALHCLELARICSWTIHSIPAPDDDVAIPPNPFFWGQGKK